MKKILSTLLILAGIIETGICGGPSISFTSNPEELFFTADVNSVTGTQWVTISGVNYVSSPYTLTLTGSAGNFTFTPSELYLPAYTTVTGKFTSVVGVTFMAGTIPGEVFMTNTRYDYPGWYTTGEPMLRAGVYPIKPSNCLVNIFNDNNVSISGMGTILDNVAMGDLRYCVTNSNNAILPSIISFSGPGMITLQDYLPNLEVSVSIMAPPSGVTISGAGAFRIFNSYAHSFVGQNLILKDAISNYGGAVYCDTKAWFDHCSFINNTSTGSGGALETNHDLYISNSYFANNRAGNSGGAIYSYYHHLYINNTTFTGNIASDGGSVYSYYKDMSINNSLFKNDSASSYGGSIYLETSINNNSNVSNCTFDKNASANVAGVIYVNDGNLQLWNTNFTNNKAKSSSGIYFQGSKLGIYSCNFENNVSTLSGVLYFGAEDNEGITMTGSSFTKNMNENSSMISLLSGRKSYVINNTFAENKAYENVIYNEDELYFINNTLAYNTCTGTSQALYIDYDSYFVNNIIANNYAMTGTMLGISDIEYIDNIIYSRNNIYTTTISGLTSGVDGNIYSTTIGGAIFNAGLSYFGGKTKVLSLVSGSPAINAGLSSSTSTGILIPPVDQRGFPTQGIKDIGAFEFGKLSQTIIGFGPFENQTFTGTDIMIPLNASASSGLPIAYSISGPAQLSGNAISVTGVGVVNISSSQAGDDFYAPVTSALSFTVVSVTGTVVTIPGTIAGISNGLENTVKIYPNPASETITIESQDEISVIAFNSEGMQVKALTVKGTQKIRFNNPGIYTLRLLGKNGIIHKKIIIQ